ncbi:dihydrodipicolinate reductase [Nocardia sp. NPDC019395]|uniref:NAD(P)H-dependent amine dehydrogenase family protein n=1 Tax=Nocardia sp. NPDC019395 TaxID=3154686 RepID=UPI0033D66BD5
MSYRVIQWATGSVGRAALECILDHPDLELAGCWVHSPDKHGRDAGEFIGRDALGVTATNSIDEILAIPADAVVYAPLLPQPDEVAALLRSGKNVVTPVGWFYPTGDRAEPVEQACHAGGTTLHGTGIDPGGVTEVFPLILSAMSSAVTYVRGEEFSDIRGYGAPDVVRHIMRFGADPAEAAAGPMQKLLDGGFRQSVRMIVDTLGFTVPPEIRTVHEMAVATAPIDSPIGTIDPGQVAAQRFHWEAVVGEEVVVRIGVNWLMGQQNLDPPWDLGAAGERFEIEIEGDPGTFVTIKGWQSEPGDPPDRKNPGIAATAAHCVNAIPYVCAAEPGIRTSVELPMVTGRAHPRLLNASRRAGTQG